MSKRKPQPGEHFKNEKYLNALGKHCRNLRRKSGLSVNRMARESERLSPSVILRLEAGMESITISSLIRYAAVLNLHPKKLLDFAFSGDFD
jgi:transcriptional regulator with XRE-family HTH domain